jgi:hypothetical protein
VERSVKNNVAKVTPRYEHHHFKPMSPGIMMVPKPLEKHEKQCFEQPKLLHHLHKAVFYLFEACLHSFDDPKFLKYAFNTMIARVTSLPPRDHGVIPAFVMGMDKCIRSVSDIVAPYYGQYILTKRLHQLCKRLLITRNMPDVSFRR